MKYIFHITVAILLIPDVANAKWGDSFSNISFLGGPVYYASEPYGWSMELLYDHKVKTCTRKSNHYGIGLVGTKSDRQFELGAKGLWNPTRVALRFSREIALRPYFYGQVDYLVTEYSGQSTDHLEAKSNFNFRPGLGFIVNTPELSMFRCRLLVQAGYTLGLPENQNNWAPLTFEVKLGVGLNLVKAFSKSPE